MISGSYDSLWRVVFVDGMDVVVPLVCLLVVVIRAAACHDGSRSGVEEPVVYVDLVGAEVDDGAASQAFVPPPISELMHRLVAVFV